LESILQFQKVIQDRVDEEVSGMNELYQAKVRSNDAQYQLIRTEKEHRVSMMVLNRLIGVPLETESQHMDSLLVISLDDAVDSQVENALINRPEMGLLKNELLTNQFDEKVTASFYNPQLNVGAGATFGAPSPGLLTEPGGNFLVNARLAIPVFYWGQKNDKVFAQQKITEQTELEIEKTKDNIKLQVISGYYEFQKSKEQVEFAFSALDNAEKNVDVMLDRYQEGLSSVLEVLDAQLSWEKSYLNYIQSKFELNMAYSTYQKAIGGLSVSQ
jgi:outer membrane protein TolC